MRKAALFHCSLQGTDHQPPQLEFSSCGSAFSKRANELTCEGWWEEHPCAAVRELHDWNPRAEHCEAREVAPAQVIGQSLEQNARLVKRHYLHARTPQNMQLTTPLL